MIFVLTKHFVSTLNKKTGGLKRNLRARHIVCAYWIDGPAHTSQDFCDDGEPGAGRALLEILRNQNMKNKVIFVTRKYGGVKMGSSRFECYRAAAEVVLKAHPWNEILSIKQQWTDAAPKGPKYQKPQSQPKADQTSEKRPANSPPAGSYSSLPPKRPNRGRNQHEGTHHRDYRQNQLDNIRGRAGRFTYGRYMSRRDDRGSHDRGQYSRPNIDSRDEWSYRRGAGRRDDEDRDWGDYYEYERSRDYKDNQVD